jgi:hypothetical protein
LDDGAGAESSDIDSGEVLGLYHHAAFRVAWTCMTTSSDEIGEAHFESALNAVAESISRLRGGHCHPHLLDVYHKLGELTVDRIDEQLVYLEREDAIIKHFYPEDAAKHDEEVAKLLTGPTATPGGTGDLPHLNGMPLINNRTDAMNSMD